MTQPPEPGQPDEPSDDDTTPIPPSYPPPGYPQPGQGQYYGQPGYGQQGYYDHNPYNASGNAPYGIHPATGLPYSDKSKIVAGLLQVLIPLGIGRMYMGQTGLGVAQLLVTVLTCGVGGLWPFIDGILILVGDKTDAQGRVLRS
jgi:TM2 domain-containing membrane protein YozV